jgi:ABC-type sugar transport system substrate-binding protein
MTAMKQITASVACLAFLLAAAASAQKEGDQARPVRIFIFTTDDPSGFIGAESKQRHDSVADVTKEFANQKLIVPVKQQADADSSLRSCPAHGRKQGAARHERPVAFLARSVQPLMMQGRKFT